MTIQMLLYILAAICFFLAAIGPAWAVVSEKVNLVALGLFLLTLTLIIK